MSRVEPRIRKGSRVIWTEHVDHMVLIFSGRALWDAGVPDEQHVYVTDIKLHSLESETGITYTSLGKMVIKSEGSVPLAGAKSIDDLRYKK